MTATGGSIEAISVAGREFSVAADGDTTMGVGGFTNELQMNGNGTVRLIKTRASWMLTGVPVMVDDDNGDLEFLQERSDEKDLFDFSVTLVSGATYQGRGQIASEIGKSTQNATVSVDFRGPGKLTKQ